MRKKLVKLLLDAILRCVDRGNLAPCPLPPIEVELPREGAHGDFASTVAMTLAPIQKNNPRSLARTILDAIDDREDIIDRIEIAGPGFINFFIRPDYWPELLREPDRLKERFGESSLGAGKNVQVEFVSANPTGPLHIGHARGAVTGDVIARILEISGYSVSREYYINDAGNQMDLLGKSIFHRYRELFGDKEPFPDDCYQGEYIITLAGEIMNRDGARHMDSEPDEAVAFFTEYGCAAIMDGIREDLAAFGVTFDRYFSEKELYENNGVARLIEELQERGFVYREGDTLWFRTTDFGDDKDRVVVRDTGEPTYFAADIGYHKNKYDRGFDTVIDVWGADHHGYIPRMYAGIQAIGKDRSALQVVLVQLVNLLRDGVPVAMSTRAGEFVTLREVIDEVGRDAARYNFLMRRSNSHLDFDLEVAKRQSHENPVYYVQYAHARIASVMRTARERGFDIPSYDDVDLALLSLEEERELVKTIDRFPDVVEGSARSLEPHRIPFYSNDLASAFHSYYNRNRIIGEDVNLSRARLFLVKNIGVVLGNALRLLGVTAPERM
ncbi:MAG: arginine--tRNA ligase [Syntrophales bacterium]|jgi:arginyl-tRNA synthetase|nr:arginine--tRNA ligase [Syntrophales bacterium]MCK9528890.1 arginine--tRNA ligase [Syntrophales bacterium]MDX9922946.1 arginine--tRNA ligase [Syntrophales bacterium]